ncbi:MAG: SEC-C domain-containing protein [Silvibacterium sp.]|nr:SEC-C domain-containing protein [Silvibacterium sp.]
MTKTHRNDPCPCNSGKKYKHCHGAVAPHADGQSERRSPPVLYAPAPNMLMNRVEREARVIANGFDEMCREHVADLEKLYGSISVLLLAGSKNAENENDHVRIVLFRVLSNALKSFTAAFSLLRTGWRLQPYQCMRNCMEALSVTLHLAIHPDELEKFEKDELISTKTFKSAKELMPQFGSVYGTLSTDFAHIGRPFRFVQKGIAYTQDESDLWYCLGALVSILWLTYQVTELVFLDSAEEPQFWKRMADRGYRMDLSEKAKAWQTKIASRYKEFMREAQAN